MLIDGARSQVDSVDSGVPQGTVLGPLLFLLFINDLPSVLDPGTVVRLFADDYRSIDSKQDQLLLQQDLDALNLRGQCWGMRFNTKKCQIIHIGKQSRHHFYQLNNDILKTATELKYLGITLTDDLKWSMHVKQTSTKAHQWLGFVKRNLKGSPYKHREMAYTSLVRSPMEYCRAIWDPVLKRDVDKLERVQRQGARWAKGAHGIVSVSGILTEGARLEGAETRAPQNPSRRTGHPP